MDPVWLLLLLLVLPSAAAAQQGAPEAIVAGRGASCPPAATCMAFEDALRNASVASVGLLGDVRVADAAPAGGALRIDRPLLVTAAPGANASALPSLDFNFKGDRAVLGPNVTLTFRDVMLRNTRQTSGLGIDFFGGREGSAIRYERVPRWRPVCTAPRDALASGLSWPRPPEVPGTNSIELADVCVRGACYPNSVVYRDFALHVRADSSESSEYLPGYTVLMLNASRLCASYIDPACAAAEPLDQCQLEATEAWLAAAGGRGGGGSRRAAAVAGGASAGVAALGAAAGFAAWTLRRRRRRRAREDEEAGAFGPYSSGDLLLSNKKGGWRIVARRAAPEPQQDRIQLGVLVGAGSFGRVYRGLWRGRDVAVKVITHDGQTAARTANEAALMMSFSHQNIVRALDVITWTRATRDTTPRSGSNCRRESPRAAAGPGQPAAPPAGGKRPAADAAGAGGGCASGPPPAALAPGDDSAEAAIGRAPSRGAPPLVPTTAGSSEGEGAPPSPPPPPPPSPPPPSSGPGSPVVRCGAPFIGDGDGALPAQMQYVPITSPLAALTPGGGAPGAGAGGAGAGGAAPAACAAGSAGTRGSSGGFAGAGAGAAGEASSGSGGLLAASEAQTWLILEFCDCGTLADAVAEGRLGHYVSARADAGVGADADAEAETDGGSESGGCGGRAGSRAGGGAPNLAKVLVRLREVAAGMVYLHARNVLHGDLKAANVLLTASPAAPFGATAKLSDFGLSRVLASDATHRSTRSVGTITHCSPELLRSGRASTAADVYAFGILMWELWSGRTAFAGCHYGEVFERVVLRGERPAAAAAADAPPGYASLMRDCWSGDPSARPGFASVLARIDAMLSDLPGTPVCRPAAGAGGGGGGGGCGSGGGNAQSSEGALARALSLPSSVFIQDL
ncbi:hypothetical protein Rsub_09492 [Raphidocelis subcapitata]|uniref:Protein kinase domain-containing protein n=1 Tax=Raphidocelis subcapitata TaxID=307507 RepID=A0A2V0PBV8_9CHLO|nr:hypothetical protein Rsub_09492 [Raphidocelis subcapitata]|eukprot:GBF97019.1 hypothetical protein Rsub_09492 [Raphidocelis subcapitata]